MSCHNRNLKHQKPAKETNFYLYEFLEKGFGLFMRVYYFKRKPTNVKNISLSTSHHEQLVLQ